MKRIVFSLLAGITTAIGVASPSPEKMWNTHYFWIKCGWGNLAAYRNFQLVYVGTQDDPGFYCSGWGTKCVVAYSDNYVFTNEAGRIKLKTFGIALPYVFTAEERGEDACDENSGPVDSGIN